jgi:hypothetical protein
MNPMPPADPPCANSAIRPVIMDAMARAIPAAACFALWCVLPGEALATQIRPAPADTAEAHIAGLLIAALIAACIGVAALAHLWSRLAGGTKSTADDEPGPSDTIEARARKAEGGEP